MSINIINCVGKNVTLIILKKASIYCEMLQKKEIQMLNFHWESYMEAGNVYFLMKNTAT